MRSDRHEKKGCSPVAGIFIVIILLFAACGGFYLTLGSPADSGSTQQISVSIPQGASTGQIGQILEDSGVIKSEFKFKLLSRIKGKDGSYKAGGYVLSPSQNLTEIMDILSLGQTSANRFTVPEGYTVDQTADKLAAEGIVDREEFMSELAYGDFDYKFMSLLPVGEKRFEGFLYPETYEVSEGATAHQVIDRMLSQFDKVMLDEYYAQATSMNMNVYDVITVASIIERETMLDSEKPMVASVIYNRLKKGIALQIDATVQYALGKHKERLKYSDLKVDSPYNTYKHPGLPPGPICSPGVESIKAALYPAQSDNYYYVLSDKQDGSHVFSATYNEFLKNKKAYQNSL